MDNPKQARGDKKVQLQIVPASAKIAIANGLVEGALKYGPWNWRDVPIKIMTYIGSLNRHMDAFIEGEELDPDGDGKTHLEGAIASLAIILDAIDHGSAIDDRPSNSNKGVLRALKRGSNKSGLGGTPLHILENDGVEEQVR